MTARSSVSVCMATYNGAGHVVAQLDSILDELGPADEVVVVDDASSDSTVLLIKSVGDDRVKVTTNETNAGHVAAFETALGLASNPIILLADQDDIWTTGRVDTFRAALAHADVVATNQDVLVDDPRWRSAGPVGRLERTRMRPAGGVVTGLMLGTAPYFGCTMGLSARARDLALPFPRFVEAHDHWIALTGARLGGIYEVSATTLLRRLHADNLTPSGRRDLVYIIRTRVRLLLGFAVLAARPIRRRLAP